MLSIFLVSCLHFEIISFRLFNSLSLENKIWNLSLRHNMHLFITREYTLAFSFMYHFIDISCLSFFLSHTYCETLVLFFLVSCLKEFLSLCSAYVNVFSVRPIECGESSAVLFDLILQPQKTLDCKQSPLRGQETFTLQLQCGFGEVGHFFLS